MSLALQGLLAVAYTLLAHLASARHDDALGAWALADLVLLLLIAPLLDRRAWAWIALPLLWLGVVWLHRNGQTAVPMLLVPVAFIAMIAWFFARTLKPGQVPLIARIVAAMEATPADALEPALRVYTRNLTAAWAWLLAVLGVANLVLALIAVPDGLIARLGATAPVTVTQAQWSWFANLLNYGIMGAFFIIEYQVRKRRFPGRYRNFADFARRLAALGPAFWRDFMR
ncbi:MAG: ketosynthase [Luteimonas sp.]